MPDTETTSVVLVGVGGQGILLASEIVARSAMISGYQVKTNEVHGMAQRGGSVIAQIRYGHQVHSPLVAEKQARVLGALEQIEAIRFAHYLSPEGLAVVSRESIVPVTVSSGTAKYPENVESVLPKAFARLKYIDAPAIAAQAGNQRTSNVVVLGALSAELDIALEAWHKAIGECVPDTSVDVNRKAFEMGRSFNE